MGTRQAPEFGDRASGSVANAVAPYYWPSANGYTLPINGHGVSITLELVATGVEVEFKSNAPGAAFTPVNIGEGAWDLTTGKVQEEPFTSTCRVDLYELQGGSIRLACTPSNGVNSAAFALWVAPPHANRS